MTQTQKPRPLANPRAEAMFVASGLDDKYRHVVAQDAHYMMNHVGCRFSDAVSSCLQAWPNVASPMAQAMLVAVEETS